MSKINLVFFEKLLTILFLSLTIFWIALYPSQSLLNLVSGIFIFCLILPSLLLEKINFKTLKHFTYLSIYFFIGRIIKEINFDKDGFFADLFGSKLNGGILSFLDLPLVIFTLVLTIYPLMLAFYSKIFKKIGDLKLTQKQWLFLNLGASFVLSGFYSLIMVLDHLSFKSHAYDFGIHDQNFYMLSHLKLPPFSTVHQINNLWMDHQHFSQLLIAPLFILGNGFNGLTLVAITPFILISIPSLFLYLSFQTINKYFKLTDKNNYWLISFTSFLMWVHPATQSAIRFYFHERYLINLFVPILIYLLCLALTKNKRILYLSLASLFSLFWLGVKEDQWIFALVFWLQVGLWIYFGGKKIWDSKTRLKFLAAAVINGVISILYSTVFLRIYKKDKALGNHLDGYNLVLDSVANLFKTGNFNAFWKSLELFSDDRGYLYQHFFIFDLPSILLLPMNSLGNYAQRTLNSKPLIRSTTFQYGSELAMYSCIGLFFLIILVIKFKPQIVSKIVTSVIIIYSIGYIAVSGSLYSGYFLAFYSPNVVLNFWKTRAERQSLNLVRKQIPDNASLVTTGFYTPQFSSRDKITNWPKTEEVSQDTKRYYVNVDYYDYWLLPKEKSWQSNTEYNSKIEEIKKSGRHSIIIENEYQILFRLKTTN